MTNQGPPPPPTEATRTNDPLTMPTEAWVRYVLELTTYGSPVFELIDQLRNAYTRSEEARLDAVQTLERLLGTPYPFVPMDEHRHLADMDMSRKNQRKLARSGRACMACLRIGFGDLPTCQLCTKRDNRMVWIGFVPLPTIPEGAGIMRVEPLD